MNKLNYKIKQIPEDFVVTEIPNREFYKGSKQTDNSKYLIYKLNKKNRNTEDCLQFISKTIKEQRKIIGFAGTKDRNAITEQFISICNIRNIKSRLEKISSNFEGFTLEFIGYSDKPIFLGDLKENKFDIVIRNLDKKDLKIISPKFIVNYFDEQRFSKNNKEIGKLIITKKFEKAVKLLQESNSINDKTIELYKEDYIKMLRHIPKKTLSFFVNSYQSFLFNELCKEIIKERKYKVIISEYSQGKLFFIDDEPIKTDIQIKLPLIGFGTADDTKYDELINKLLEKENITKRDFIIKQIPELSSFGVERDFLVIVNNFVASNIETDELNPDKYKISVSFSLFKGSYATMILKKIFSTV